MTASKRSSDLDGLFEEMSQLGEEEKKWKRVDEINMACVELGLPNAPYQLEMNVYGSTAEDLKGYLPKDMGDLDIMLYPTAEEAMLDEYMLEYVDGEPAFVRVRGNGHPLLQKCLYGETDFVATSTLKELDPTIFGIVPVLLSTTLPKITKRLCAISDGSSQAFKNLGGPSFQTDISQSLDNIKEQIHRISLKECDSLIKIPDDIKRLCDFAYQNTIDWDGLEKYVNTIRTEHRQRIKENPTIQEAFEVVGDSFFRERQTSKVMSLLSHFHQKSAENQFGEKLPDDHFAVVEKVLHKVLLNSFQDSVDSLDQNLQQANNSLRSGLDLVPSFKVRGWPQVADGWISRDRKWPSDEVISKIMDSGFHLVVKASTYGTTRPDIDFRLSFSHAELLLSKELNDIQRECYRCFKLFYKSLNENEEPKIITTYVLKSTLLWTIEETGMEMWNMDNRASCVMMLLEKLHHSLETKYVPHYFIPELNLVEEAVIKYPQRLQNLADEIREICDNPIEWYHQRSLKSELNFSDKGQMTKPSKKASATQPVKKVNDSGSFQFMPADDFEELYRDVCREIVDMAMADEMCPVEDSTMQTITGFLQSRLVGSETDDPENTLLNSLPDSKLIRALYFFHTGQNARERILSAIKGQIDIQIYIEDNDMEEESLTSVIDSLECRGKNGNLDFVNTLFPQFGRRQEEFIATISDVFFPPAPTYEVASDDDIPLA